MVQAAGWDAIDGALRSVYADEEPLHWGTVARWRLGGPDPLDGISAYRRPDHWHFVSYGLSELYTKESDDPDVSGWGIELTFRLSRANDEKGPPQWPLGLLQNLARYVCTSGKALAPGHHMHLRGPIAGGANTLLRASLFDLDAELGEVTAPHGRLQFVQVVGITEDELDAVKDWDGLKLLREFRASNPLLITDISRGSLLQNPPVASAIASGILADGSSYGASAVTVLKVGGLFGRTKLTIGAVAVPELIRGLRRRIPFAREFQLVGGDGACHVQPGSACVADRRGSELFLTLTRNAAREIADTLCARRGTYSWPVLPGFKLNVVPTEVKTPEGAVVEVIG